ncbi:MAG: DUF86 domain-containing protein [Bacillota bacterium]|nr:DUF86 domain-containing protein [Bacillota bacterium]MDW7683965.1 DUF86 domain-containing protein [Bacillota bacterium]
MRYSGEEDMIRQLSRFDEILADWRRYREKISLRDLLDNRDIRNMVLYAMLITIQAAIRSAHHLIVQDYLPKPGTYEETFLILRKAGILDQQMADDMARLSSYRQGLVHSHEHVDLREIYEILTNDLQTLELYRAKLEKIIKEK